MLTVGLARLPRPDVAAVAIDLLSDGIKMVRVDAATVSTQVIEYLVLIQFSD